MKAMRGRLSRTLALATATIMLLLVGGAISLAADPLVVWCEPQKQATIQAVTAEWSRQSGIPVRWELCQFWRPRQNPACRPVGGPGRVLLPLRSAGHVVPHGIAAPIDLPLSTCRSS